MLGPDDVRLLERAATVAALAITKEQAVSAVESKRPPRGFLRDALAGRAGTPEEAVAHAQSLGWDIDRPMVVVVAETDEDDERTTRSAERGALAAAPLRPSLDPRHAGPRPAAPVMGFSRVVALFGVADPADTEQVMRIVADVAREWYAATAAAAGATSPPASSRPISSVAELPSAYDEALSAVSVGRQMHGDGALPTSTASASSGCSP